MACTEQSGTPPVADFFVYNVPCVAPCEVYFFDHSERAVSYQYNFGNGTSSNLQNDTVLYQSAGENLVELTVTAENGLSHSKKKNILILPADTMVLLNMELLQYKQLTSSWVSWDLDETLGEDLYVNITYNGTILFTSDSIALSNMMSSDLPISFNLNSTYLFDDQGMFQVLLYDKDSLSSDDLIGFVEFSPMDYNNSSNSNPASSILLENMSDSLRLNLEVDWR